MDILAFMPSHAVLEDNYAAFPHSHELSRIGIARPYHKSSRILQAQVARVGLGMCSHHHGDIWQLG